MVVCALISMAAVAQPRNLGLVSYRPPAVPRLVTDGSAIVALTIRANGRVDDSVALAASGRVFANSAAEAVLGWRFERDPKLGLGRGAVPSLVLRREIVEFVFKRGGVVTSMSHFESAKTWFPAAGGSSVSLVRSEDLDTPLTRTEGPPGEDTAKLASSLSAAAAVIVSFVVDETGGVRVPLAENTEDPALIAAALEVVRGWRYEPPLRGGKPVLVEERARLTFFPRPPQ